MAVETKSYQKSINWVKNCEGSVLTSGQKTAMRKYLKQRPRDYENYQFDGNMVDACREIWRDEPDVLENLDQSIHDPHCTKSFYHFDAMLTTLEKFCEESPSNKLWNINVRVGCALVVESLKIHLLDPLPLNSEEDIDALISNKQAKCGFIHLGKTKVEAKAECLAAAKKIKRNLAKGVTANFVPIQMFHRGQISGFISDGKYDGENLKMKDRVVCCVDGGTSLIEFQYGVPFQDHCGQHWDNYVGGKSPEAVRALIWEARKEKFYWTSLDYSGFDMTVPSWLLQWCGEVLKRFYAPKYHAEIDWTLNNMIHGHIAVPGLGIMEILRGLVSGTKPTQLFGSMSNSVITLSAIASRCDGDFQTKLNYVREQVQLRNGVLADFVEGDDALLFTKDPIDLKAFSEYVYAVYGMKIHPDKCASGDRYSNPHGFLKREWRHYGEWQDPSYLVINLCHPEFKRTYEDYSPWHILYGMYLTYKESFPNWVSEAWFIQKMGDAGGIRHLASIPKSSLPGVLRPFGDKALERLINRAEDLRHRKIS
jgi:hypothetical protein